MILGANSADLQETVSLLIFMEYWHVDSVELKMTSGLSLSPFKILSVEPVTGTFLITSQKPGSGSCISLHPSIEYAQIPYFGIFKRSSAMVMTPEIQNYIQSERFLYQRLALSL